MRRFFFLIISLMAVNLTIYSQCPAPMGMLTHGETVQYNLYFNWHFIWIKAGFAELKTISIPYDGQEAFETTMLNSTNHSADAIFRMRDTLQTIVTPELVPLRYSRRCYEAKSQYTDRANYEYQNGQCITQLEKTYKDGTIKRDTLVSDDCVFDMVSLLLYSRTFDTESLQVGDRMQFPVIFGVNIENEHIVYMGKEEVPTLSGNIYHCQIFDIYEEVVGKKGQMKDQRIARFYTTDDANHLPLMLEFDLKFGSAVAKIVSAEGLKYPLTPYVATDEDPEKLNTNKEEEQ